MDEAPPNYRGRFAKSPHHLALAFLTIGLGIATAHPLGFLLGAAAYALGWVYLPDSSMFRRWVDDGRAAERRAAEATKVAEFVRRRDAMLDALVPQRRELYEALASVCRDIERASADSPLTPRDPNDDPRLRKLDELMWTYLRLLGIEESLERFVDTERGEDVPGLVREAEAQMKTVAAETQELETAKASTAECESKKRLFASLSERAEVLRKRLERCRQAQENLRLVAAERDRLVQQVKLIRADAVATRNAEGLTTRIDATVEHLGETNKWLSELDEFKDMVGDLPPTQARIGFESAHAAPPIAAAAPEPPPPQRAFPRAVRRFRREEEN
jgi:hypothetical protein